MVFASPPSRTSSERPDRDFHPEYRSSGARSRSTGSNIDVDFIAELMDRQQKSTEMMAAALDKLASGGARSVPISTLGGFEDTGRHGSSS